MNESWDYVKDKIFGVNLGGWLVVEVRERRFHTTVSKMVPYSPSLYHPYSRRMRMTAQSMWWMNTH